VAGSAPLKLQAIRYRLTKPSVLINNKTLFLGDEIGGAKLVAIERQRVRLVGQGQTTVLEMQ
jgi:hypothetical protein